MKEKQNIQFIKPILWDRFKSFPKNSFYKYKLPRKFLWHNATTTLFQICFHIGCKNIAIIGIDGYKLDSNKNHFSNYCGNEISSIESKFRANKSITDLQEAVFYYSKKNNINIFNLSKKSIINQYPKITFEEYLEIINDNIK